MVVVEVVVDVAVVVNPTTLTVVVPVVDVVHVVEALDVVVSPEPEPVAAAANSCR